jgi:hypothetical protein
MNETVEWTALANELLRVGRDIFATIAVPVTEKGCADEKYRACLLAPTMSNLRGALLLLDNRRVVEGRILTRCCLENSYCIARLVTEGETFAREMLHDEISHRQQRGERLFETGAPLGDEWQGRGAN